MRLKTRIGRWRTRRKGTVVYQGLKVPLDTTLVTGPVLDALWKGVYEGAELRALGALMRPDDRVLELGAGMGVVSGAMARRHPQSRFLSYEANPSLAPVIRALHQRNGITNVELRSALLAPGGGSRAFRVHEHFTESSLVADTAQAAVVDVPVDDPAKIFAAFRPDLLLCDIEGGEEELIPVLPLASVRAVVIELHPTITARPGMARIYEALISAGLIPMIEHSSDTVVAFERVAS